MKRIFFLKPGFLFPTFLLLILIFSSLCAMSQAKRISGVVKDEKSNPAADVTVSVKGGTDATFTDAQGRFAISANKGSVLVFSSVGYLDQQVTIGDQDVVNISLSVTSGELNEVVVVGYGDQSRRNVTGAVTTVKAAAIRNLPVASIDSKLSGQMAGVQVQQVNGVPGGGAVVRVRGSGSIGAGDDPLYVIDGFPISNSYNKDQNPLATINPADIESVTVLKDAASTSIYGSRGSNGVILIVTKNAKRGQSTIEVNSYAGVQTIPERQKLKMMTAQQFAQFRNEHYQDLAAFQGVPFDPESVPEEYRNPASLGKGTNWFEEITRPGPMQDVSISFSNGTDKFRSVFSGGYFNQTGTILNTSFERFSLRANMEGNFAKRLTAGLSLAPTYSRRRAAVTEGHFNTAVITDALLNSPLAPVRLADGSLNPVITSPEMFVNANPVNVLLNNKNRISNMRLLSTVFLRYEILKGLAIKTTFNADLNNDKQDAFNPSNVGGFRDPPPVLASGFLSTNLTLNWLNENTINYDFAVNDHSFSLLAGYSIQNERSDQNRINGSGYANDVVQTINGATVYTTTAAVQQWRLLSTYGRLQYAFKDRYLLTGTIRRDGSSRFGLNNQYGTFPSGSIGWRLSDEKFFPKTSFINEMKIRASHGLSGNNNIGNYAYLPTIVADNYIFNGGLSSGVRTGSLANQDLGWESSRQTDFGLDVSLFNNRVNFIAEYYTRITEDMLQNIDISASSGFTTAITNLGKVSNKGWEFTVNSRNFIGAFNWSTDFNISFNKNKVLNIGNRALLTSGNNAANVTIVGQPMGMFYGSRLVGIYQNQKDLDDIPHYSGATIGSFIFEDVNKDGLSDNADFTIIGNPYAKFILGLTNNFSYGNFDLSIFIKASHGAQILDLYKRFTQNPDGVFNPEADDIINRWRSEANPGNGKMQSSVGFTDLTGSQAHSGMVRNASFLNVQNIALGYNFKTKPSAGGLSIRLYASVQNALLISPYRGGFPEVNINGNNSLAPGVNYIPYPVPSTITFGTNIRF